MRLQPLITPCSNCCIPQLLVIQTYQIKLDAGCTAQGGWNGANNHSTQLLSRTQPGHVRTCGGPRAWGTRAAAAGRFSPGLLLWQAAASQEGGLHSRQTGQRADQLCA